MTIECYDNSCPYHGEHFGGEGPFCDEPECRKQQKDEIPVWKKPGHICGDPNSPCDMDCMARAYEQEQILSIPKTIKEKKVKKTNPVWYLVIRCGFHIQEVAGIYSSEEKAIQISEWLYSKEPDNYHLYQIQPIELDKKPKIWELDPDFPVLSNSFIRQLPAEEARTLKKNKIDFPK